MKLKNKIVALALTVASAFGLAVANKNVTKVEAASETITFSNLGYSNAADLTTISATNFTLTFSAGSNTSSSPKYYNSGTAARLYGGNELKIEVNEGNVITSVDFTFNGSSYKASASNAGGTDCSWNTSTYTSVTPNNATQNSVTIKNTASSGHMRITTLTVNYEASGSVVEKSDAEKLAEAVADLSITNNYMLPLSGSYGATISWESNNEAVAINNQSGIVTITKGNTNISGKLTATIKIGDLAQTKDFDFIVSATTSNDPIVGKTYKMVINHTSQGKQLYFTSTMNGYYYTTTEDITNATDISYEATFSGYYMTFNNSSGKKKYMNISINGSYINLVMADTPNETIWVYNSDYNTMVATIDGTNYYFMGARGTYTTYGAYALSNATDSDYYVAHLVTQSEVSIADQIAALETMAQFGVDYTKDTKKSITTKTVVAQYTTKTTTNFSDDDCANLIFGENANLFSAYSIKNNVTNHIGLNKDGTIRLYGTQGKVGNELKIESKLTITTISLEVNSGTDYEVVVNDTVLTADDDGIYDVNANSFIIRHNGATGKEQVRLNSLTINVAGEIEEDVYSNFANAKMRFVGIIPADLATEVASAGVKLTMGTTTKNYDATLVGETDADKSFAVVLSNIPSEQYATEITATAYVVLNDGTTVELQSKTYSVNTIVQYYLDNATNLNLNAEDIAILTAFKNA